MRVFILAPANVATGGPELLHQFARCLTKRGIETYMVYPDADGINCPVPEVYWKYDNRYVSQYIDSGDSVLVLPETQIHHIDLCQKGTAMVWWLSVNNYFRSYKSLVTESSPDVFRLKLRKNVVHFAQSHYAKMFVTQHFGITPSPLKDFINDDIMEFAAFHQKTYERKKLCLYNPSKGYHHLEPVIRACRNDIRWEPLSGYQPLEMASLMCQARLYVDFGDHPGKDRIPREAAVCGCCILTNRRGSAAYQEDVGIPETYKIEDTGQIDAVLEKIYDLVDHYGERIHEYSAYRNAVRAEKMEFLADMDSAIAVLRERTIECEHVEIPKDDRENHDRMLSLLESSAGQVEHLFSQARNACLKGRADVTDRLLAADYAMQVVRESLYAELAVLADLE